MGVRLGLSFLVVAVLGLPAAANASHDPSGKPFGEDFVMSDVPAGPALIDAHSAPSGTAARGTVIWPTFSGPVTCLNVSGNHATIGVRFSFVPWLYVVEDNSASGEPDRIGGREFPSSDMSVCPADAEVTLVTGFNFVVHDAPALPTTKEQCKNGGWRTYGIFKSQGDCVSFVATGGKNPPANSP